MRKFFFLASLILVLLAIAMFGWGRALAEMRSVDPQVEMNPVYIGSEFAECFDFWFTGVRGARIYAKYLRPKKSEGKHPAIVQFHGYSHHSGDWFDKLGWVAKGYSVLAMDLRGQGASSGDANWPLAQEDVRAALNQLAGLPGIDGLHVFVVGASIGANLGLNACADYAGCAGTVLLSPGLDYRGITTTEAMARLGSRPVLIVASENDNNNPSDSVLLDSMAAGSHRLVIYPSAGHGTDMFTAEPGLFDVILNWIHEQPSTS
jgi:alpha-beta hydrolase superfamily lysophospholipase